MMRGASDAIAFGSAAMTGGCRHAICWLDSLDAPANCSM